MKKLSGYRHIWVFDFEYVSDAGEVPDPVCLAAIDLVTDERILLWRDEMRQDVPFPTDETSLFICYSGAGDIGCFLELGWPLPARLLDLYPEARQLLYDLDGYKRPSLLNVARLLDLDTMESQAKDDARDLIIQRRFTDADRDYLLAYCMDDVELTAEVFRLMYPVLTDTIHRWNGCLLRGRYTTALARVEKIGVPIDVDNWQLAVKHWQEVQRDIVTHLDTGGVYEGTTFKMANFETWLARHELPWPRLESGALDLEDGTFRKQAAAYGGVIGNLREVRYMLGQMRLASYTVGRDGRNRVFLNPYGAVTGRNQPSNSRFIFGSAKWTRSFIKPGKGRALAYVDWSSQEIAIAAALSGDTALWEDYCVGDIYIAFAIRASMAPPGATKATHPIPRRRCKATVLGLGYGLTEHGLSVQLGIKLDAARQLVQLHREAYPVFHKWVEQQAQAGSLGLPLRTRFHWERRMKPGSRPNLRSLKNYYMQANGADMMRLAVCELADAGISVCCPVHDAVLIETSIEQLDVEVAATQQIMGDVSEVVLGDGYRVGTGVDVVRYPDVYVDEGAGTMYQTVMEIAQAAAQADSDPSVVEDTLLNG